MPQATAVTIGNFDGAHCGHIALVHAARAHAGPSGRVVVLSFDPHPLSLLRPEAAPPRLTTFAQRARRLSEAGADEVIRVSPTRDFLSQSPEAFIRSVVDRHRPTAIVEGDDFHFGRARAGSVRTLEEFEHEHAYCTIIVEPVQIALQDHTIVRASSSMIRWLLSRGRVGDAAKLLGRDYELECEVVRGEQRGRTIGIPTANLDQGECLLPADGIYSGSAELSDGSVYAAAISVGTKPTFGEHPRMCEAHLLKYDGPLDHYGWRVRLGFTAWLRDQLKFDGVEPLVMQLRRDVQRVEQAWRVPDTLPA